MSRIEAIGKRVGKVKAGKVRSGKSVEEVVAGTEGRESGGRSGGASGSADGGKDKAIVGNKAVVGRHPPGVLLPKRRRASERVRWK